jgi:hypothetical protein
MGGRNKEEWEEDAMKETEADEILQTIRNRSQEAA